MKKICNVTIIVLLIISAGTLVAGATFREICRDLVEKSGDASIVKGADGWLFLKEELIHLAAGRFWGEDASAATRTKKKEYGDPLPAIVEYNSLLAEKGITLYLMPVPPKALVYSDKLDAAITAESVSDELVMYSEFYALLEKKGVRVIDLLPLLEKNKDKSKVYCKTDTHFSPDGLAYFAEAAATAIKEEAWYPSISTQKYEKTPRKVMINGDLARMAGGETVVEELELKLVADQAGKALESDPKSPVILLGDSHTLVFSAGGDLHAKGAGLFDHLSAELGFPVDLLGVRGSGVTPARIKLFQRSKKEGNYLEGKKALIWCFAARDFTGSGGWRKIPVAP
ncbi:MAG: alginate O-acetyltransferase AlgX-related protein [Desulforhopalus sp.]